VGNEKDSSQLTGEVAADLLRAGLLVHDTAQDGNHLRMVDAGLAVFLPLLTSFDVKIVPVSKQACPVRFCTGILTTTTGFPEIEGNWMTSLPGGGQGRTSIDAAFGCLGELAERLSLCSLGKRDGRIFNKRREQPQVDISKMIGLSDAQGRRLLRTAHLESGGQRDGLPDWAVLSDRRVEIRRLGGISKGQLPSIGILFNELEQITAGRLSLASSAGCAVWSDFPGARERALLELVERDAVAQGWYNRLGITMLDHGYLREILPESYFSFLSGRQRHWDICSLDTDLDSCVAIAVSYEEDGRAAAFGSSAGWNFASACEGAVEEMLQSENSLEMMAKVHPEMHSAEERDTSLPRQLAYARQRSVFDDLPLKAAPAAGPRDPEKSSSYESLLGGCLEKGIEIWEFDATRPDLNIPCVKLLSPDLCSWEPRFGKRRLYEGVVERGLRAAPATEAEFAARSLPF